MGGWEREGGRKEGRVSAKEKEEGEREINANIANQQDRLLLSIFSLPFLCTIKFSSEKKRGKKRKKENEGK